MEPLLLKPRIMESMIAPEANRIKVKLAASISCSPSARRHSTELAAKAVSANPVKIIVLKVDTPGNCSN